MAVEFLLKEYRSYLDSYLFLDTLFCVPKQARSVTTKILSGTWWSITKLSDVSDTYIKHMLSFLCSTAQSLIATSPFQLIKTQRTSILGTAFSNDVCLPSMWLIWVVSLRYLSVFIHLEDKRSNLATCLAPSLKTLTGLIGWSPYKWQFKVVIYRNWNEWVRGVHSLWAASSRQQRRFTRITLCGTLKHPIRFKWLSRVLSIILHTRGWSMLWYPS